MGVHQNNDDGYNFKYFMAEYRYIFYTNPWFQNYNQDLIRTIINGIGEPPPDGSE